MGRPMLLHPHTRDRLPLCALSEQAVVGNENQSGGVAVLTVSGMPRLTAIAASQRITPYRIAREALTHARRHRRTRHVGVVLRFTGRGVEMNVRDDGYGCAATARCNSHRYGLAGMRDRGTPLRGSMALDTGPGRGTLLGVFLPRTTPMSDAVA